MNFIVPSNKIDWEAFRPLCKCPSVLTDTIRGCSDEGNWWHQEPCPLVYWLRAKYQAGVHA